MSGSSGYMMVLTHDGRGSVTNQPK